MSAPIEVIGDLQSDNDALIKKLDQQDERILELEQQAQIFKSQIVEHEDTWLAICGDIAKLEDFMSDDDTWENADPEDLYQFDPWHCLKQSLEFMKKQKRHNELLRGLEAVASDYINGPSASAERWKLYHAYKESVEAAIDGGALDGENQTWQQTVDAGE